MTFDAHFTIANIPFGVASRNNQDAKPQTATRLKEHVYFLPELLSNKLLRLPEDIAATLQEVCSVSSRFLPSMLTNSLS